MVCRAMHQRLEARAIPRDLGNTPMVSITGQSAETLFRRVATISGAMVMLLGILGLAGWLAGAGKLAIISWRYIPMAQSTAWSCLFLGSSLLLYRSRPLEGRGRGWRWR